MWEPDHIEGWAPNNWCFWIVVLEKTLGNPLDFKEIKPVNPKRNQPQIFIGWTDAEAEAPILYPTISSFASSFSFCLRSFSASGSFWMNQLFESGGQSIATWASVLPMNIQGLSPLELTGWSCCPKDSEESSPEPQFKSLSSSVLSPPYGPTLTSVHDYWKNHSFDCMDLCWQSDVSAF